LSDGLGRPLALLLTAGNINDIGVARALLQRVGPVRRLIADRGYDANHLRRFLADQQAEALIPFTTSRRKPIPTTPSPTETAIVSNACGAASRTGAASPHDTTSSHATTSAVLTWPQSSLAGLIESGP
jgi:IS5 family transposase